MRISNVSRQIIAAICLAAFFSGCGGFKIGKFPAYFDENTYKSMISAKVNVMFLYESLGEPEADMEDIRSARMDIARMHEYEKGKGEANSATASQIGLIRDAFDSHIRNRMEKEKWEAFDIEDFSEIIAEYFDIAIRTERSKNKNWEQEK